MNYDDFLKSKASSVPCCGFSISKSEMRSDKDEKHICPLQLPVIERCIDLWTNPGDLVLDPFDGIGSTGYQALKMGRRHIGVELKESYFRQAAMNLATAESEYFNQEAEQ